MTMQINGTAIDKNDNFDRDMQQLHATAVENISPQTLARLRASRHGLGKEAAPRRGHSWRWMAATTFSAVLAVAIGMQFLPTSQPVVTASPEIATVAVDDYGEGVTVLDESPDLYVWLASSEAEPLAME
jgi:anti-sigma-K factor RskA